MVSSLWEAEGSTLQEELGKQMKEQELPLEANEGISEEVGPFSNGLRTRETSLKYGRLS